MKLRSCVAMVFAIATMLNGAGCRSFPYFVGLSRVSPAQAAPAVSQLSTASLSSTETLEEGRTIYTTQCVRCHSCIPIQNFTTDDWMNSIIPRMATKAKLSPDEAESLEAYVAEVHRHLPSILLSSSPSEYR